MSTKTKEFVAVAHALIGLNEPALKQLAVIFNRIGIQGLSMDLSKTPFISCFLSVGQLGFTGRQQLAFNYRNLSVNHSI